MYSSFTLFGFIFQDNVVDGCIYPGFHSSAASKLSSSLKLPMNNVPVECESCFDKIFQVVMVYRGRECTTICQCSGSQFLFPCYVAVCAC